MSHPRASEKPSESGIETEDYTEYWRKVRERRTGKKPKETPSEQSEDEADNGTVINLPPFHNLRRDGPGWSTGWRR